MISRITNATRTAITVFAFSLLFSSAIFAQAVAQADAGKTHPDFSGIWLREGGFSLRFSTEEPPLQPWAMEQYKANRAGTNGPNERRDDLDPVTSCFPAGFPRSMILNLNNALEIVQLKDRIHVLFERHPQGRRIYIDGRGHPADGVLTSWSGHSVGKWEGETLVVDTIGLHDKAWLDRAGVPHSSALHVVERFRLRDPETLDIEFLFDDPKAFTKPWGGTKGYKLKPNFEMLEFVPCEEFLEMGKHR